MFHVDAASRRVAVVRHFSILEVVPFERNQQTSGSNWNVVAEGIVRGPEQLERIERYIRDNPSGLPAERFSLGCIHYIKPYPTNDLLTASGE